MNQPAPLAVDGPTFLYRFYDAADQLLYVGVAFEPAVRWRRHANERDWWDEVARIDAVRLESRKAALQAERLAIKVERPRHNQKHTHAALARVPASRAVPREPTSRPVGPEQLRQAVQAGQWLTPGEAAVVLRLSRMTVHRWIAKGWIGYRQTPGGHRKCNPEDLQRLLATNARRHEDSPPAEG